MKNRSLLILGALTALVVSPLRGEPAAIFPDYEKFDQKQADFVNGITKKRPLVYQRLAEYLVKRFDLTKRPGIAIDIGGGPGELMLELAKRTEKFYFVNTDVNTYFLQPFAADALERGLTHRVGFVFADAGALPFGTGSVELVVSRGAYQFWGDLEKGVTEAFRVLKPGGEAFIGRGFPPTMPPEEIRHYAKRKLVGGPKYDPDKDADRFRSIAANLAVSKYEILRHKGEDPTINFGVWLYFRK